MVNVILWWVPLCGHSVWQERAKVMTALAATAGVVTALRVITNEMRASRCRALCERYTESSNLSNANCSMQKLLGGSCCSLLHSIKKEELLTVCRDARLVAKQFDNERVEGFFIVKKEMVINFFSAWERKFVHYNQGQKNYTCALVDFISFLHSANHIAPLTDETCCYDAATVVQYARALSSPIDDHTFALLQMLIDYNEYVKREADAYNNVRWKQWFLCTYVLFGTLYAGSCWWQSRGAAKG